MKKNNINKAYIIVIGILMLSSINLNAFSQYTTKNKLVYEWHAPDNQDSFPAVLVIGGSEGGLNYGQAWAKILTKQGFGVMALSYFGLDGQPQQLEEIPLEYFQTALDTMLSFKGVLANKIAIISVSKGTEPALILAAGNKSIRLVIAASPSHVVWQGINKADYSSVKSSWLKNGKPMPFVPYNFSNGYYPLVNFYQAALDNPFNEQAIIPVENSDAEIILFSGAKDQVWPASRMAEAMEKRLKLKKQDGKLKCIDFADAGHGFLIPFQNQEEKKKILAGIEPNINFLGGSLEAFDDAMTKSNEAALIALQKLKNTNK